jgi:[ribosomal protein S5]-alanine N-acetyltransferase
LPIELRTERLILRDHRIEDVGAYHALVSDPRAMRFLPGLLAADPAVSRKRLVATIEDSERPERRFFFFGIFHADDGRYVGETGFTVLDADGSVRTADFGYFLHAAFWGSGYATEAGRRVVRFAFEDRGVDRIVAGCDRRNAASERVMIKLGFTRIAETDTRLTYALDRRRT